MNNIGKTVCAFVGFLFLATMTFASTYEVGNNVTEIQVVHDYAEGCYVYYVQEGSLKVIHEDSLGLIQPYVLFQENNQPEDVHDLQKIETGTRSYISFIGTRENNTSLYITAIHNKEIKKIKVSDINFTTVPNTKIYADNTNIYIFFNYKNALYFSKMTLSLEFIEYQHCLVCADGIVENYDIHFTDEDFYCSYIVTEGTNFHVWITQSKKDFIYDVGSFINEPLIEVFELNSLMNFLVTSETEIKLIQKNKDDKVREISSVLYSNDIEKITKMYPNPLNPDNQIFYVETEDSDPYLRFSESSSKFYVGQEFNGKMLYLSETQTYIYSFTDLNNAIYKVDFEKSEINKLEIENFNNTKVVSIIFDDTVKILLQNPESLTLSAFVIFEDSNSYEVYNLLSIVEKLIIEQNRSIFPKNIQFTHNKKIIQECTNGMYFISTDFDQSLFYPAALFDVSQAINSVRFFIRYYQDALIIEADTNEN